MQRKHSFIDKKNIVETKEKALRRANETKERKRGKEL